MSISLEEEERIAQLKGWWKKYGNFILVVVIVAALTSLGWQYWQGQKLERSLQASLGYEHLLRVSGNDDLLAVQTQASYLQQQFADTPYAALAGLFSARQAVVAGELEDAQQQLMWVIENAEDKTLRQLARLRSARISLVQEQPEQALNTLDKVDDANYMALINELKGDSYLALAENAKAREAYQQALQAEEKTGFNSPLLKIKYDGLIDISAGEQIEAIV